MTVPGKPGTPRPPKPDDSEFVAGTLSHAVLNYIVGDLPGPPRETEAERAVRFDAQMAEVLSYNPRDAAGAMMAAQCVMFRMLADDSKRDAARPNQAVNRVKQHLRSAKQFNRLINDLKGALDRQGRSLPRLPALPPGPPVDVGEILRILGLSEPASPAAATMPAPSAAAAKPNPVVKLTPEPKRQRDDAGQSDDAASAIIIAMHPAPKMLQ